jgi:hypothetical protein
MPYPDDQNMKRLTHDIKFAQKKYVVFLVIIGVGVMNMQCCRNKFAMGGSNVKDAILIVLRTPF